MNLHIQVQVLHRVAQTGGPVVVPKCLTSILQAGDFAMSNMLWLDIFRNVYTFAKTPDTRARRPNADWIPR